jgi:hypothetical protein
VQCGRLIAVGVALAVTFLIVTHPESPGAVPGSFPHIARRPATWRRPATRVTTLPAPRDPMNPREIDLRSCDLSAMDLSKLARELDNSKFDGTMRWPASMPADSIQRG